MVSVCLALLLVTETELASNDPFSSPATILAFAATHWGTPQCSVTMVRIQADTLMIHFLNVSL